MRWTLSKKTRTQFEPIGWTAALAALAVTGSRGGNQVALKFGLTAFSPAGTAFGRMLVGMLTVGLWAWFRGVPLRPQRGEWRSLMQLSLLFVVQIGLLHIGADLTSPAYAVVLMNSNPVFANLMAHFVVAGDRLSPSRLLGLMLAFGAVAAVLLGRPNGVLASKPVLGNSIVLAAAVLVAVRTLYTQRLVQKIDTTKTVFWQMLFSLPCFGAAALFLPGVERGSVNLAALLGLLYQGIVVSGLSFIGWVALLRKHSPGRLTVFSFTTPLIGVLLSSFFFSERVTARLVLGLLAVVVGIFLASRGGRRVESEPAANDEA